MTSIIAAFTAAHPYLSGISLWLLFNLIATVLWSLCKVRSSEDDEVCERRGVETPRGSSGPVRTPMRPVGERGSNPRRVFVDVGQHPNEAGSTPADAHSYTPPSFTKPAVKGFSRSYLRDADASR